MKHQAVEGGCHVADEEGAFWRYLYVSVVVADDAVCSQFAEAGFVVSGGGSDLIDGEIEVVG